MSSSTPRVVENKSFIRAASPGERTAMLWEDCPLFSFSLQTTIGESSDRLQMTGVVQPSPPNNFVLFGPVKVNKVVQQGEEVVSNGKPLSPLGSYWPFAS